MSYNLINKITGENLNDVMIKINETIGDSILESSYYNPIYHDDMLASTRIVLIHLLKVAYQPEKQSKSWVDSITEHYKIVYTTLVKKDKKHKLNDNEYDKFLNKFPEIVANSIHYASLETGLPEKDVQLTYGMGPRIFLSKEWLLYFMKLLIQKEPLRTKTFNDQSEFMKMIRSLPNIDKYDLNKINKELGEPEIYE